MTYFVTDYMFIVENAITSFLARVNTDYSISRTVAI